MLFLSDLLSSYSGYGDYAGMYVLYSVLGVLGAILSTLIIVVIVRLPGMRLRKKFGELGILKGKTLTQIKAVAGAPSAVSYTSGYKVAQWIATGYHISLIFDENDVCLGVSDEIAV